MNPIQFLICFIVVIIYKAFSNTYYYFQSIKLSNDYSDFLKNESSSVFSKKQDIQKLFSRAHIKNSYVPVTQPVGYGYLQAANYPIIDNMFVKDQRVVSAIIGMFEEATGVYRRRIFESFNPIFWVETIIYLPRSIIAYLGLSTDVIAVKIIQVIWWIIAPMAIIYRNSLISVFQNLFN
ncbi:MAG: hypothetical protein CVU92_03640 [Firmicutes bacterium HGW-Firmicutes-17]|jgi:hypothetical protein|nr:MAG: hypothetical protein CVU92_03640 [Firmicutes bacterium HGW-Firmicutes-17]